MPTPRKKRSRKSKAEEEVEETPAEQGGILLVLLGGVGIFALALSPWDLFNAIPKVLGIIACAFIVTAGGILLQPPEKRGKTAEQLLTLFLAFVRAVRDLVARNRDREEE